MREHMKRQRQKDDILPRVQAATSSVGQPLDTTTRNYMEPRFGHDFSQVRVHADERATEAAHAVNAPAFTLGDNLLFASDLYSPGTDVGKRLIAHELAHVIQQRTEPVSGVPLVDGLLVSEPNDRFEQAANRVAAQVMGNGTNTHTGMPSEQLTFSHGTVSSPIPVIQRGPGDFTAERMVRDSIRTNQYERFIHNAEVYGLPVKFLQKVGRDYRIVVGSDETNTFFNTMELSDDTMNDVEDMSPTGPIGGSVGIQTIYHESTHAYLDLLSGDARFQRFISGGEQHYEDAPTKSGHITNSPSRVFQEAAASYVGHRAASWWRAFEDLATYAERGRLNAKSIARIRQDYNAQMAERTFGYSYEGGFLGSPLGGEQVETNRPMTSEMKQFLDLELLEDRIPDNFDSVAGFQQIIATAVH